jgi:hypothetical protein
MRDVGVADSLFRSLALRLPCSNLEASDAYQDGEYLVIGLRENRGFGATNA